MEMRWFDVRLANNYSKSIRIREMSVIEKIWTPDPYFVNSKYSYFHVVSFPNFRMRISPNGLVVYTLRLSNGSVTFKWPEDDHRSDDHRSDTPNR
uniref:Neur_chan_LBD domain-containing protein n=1 Tax=Ascaris lumbricoides TaxID=6252 RepID=A0A0M3HFI9_ASCLU